MPSNLTDVSLPKLFEGRFFSIPDYQRGYAWGDSQLQDMWDDIQNIPSPSTNYYHYTGSITLKKRTQLNLDEQFLENLLGGEFCDVVDGQQRLTTLVIFMAQLIKRMPLQYQGNLNKIYLLEQPAGANPVYKLAYSDIQGNNNQHLLRIIFNSTTALPSLANVYTNNIDNAKKFFDQKLANLSDVQVQELYVKMSKSLIFDIKYISNNLHVQAVFETMNNRGKSLTILEKLKNRLMFMACKLPNSGLLPDKINTAWGGIYNKLGANSSNPLKEDEFLSAHLTLLREPADYVYSEPLAEERLFKMFCNRATSYDDSDARQHASRPEPPVDYQKIDTYASDLSSFVEYWYKVYFPDITTDIGLLVKKIQYLDGSKEMRLFLSKIWSLYQNSSNEVMDCLKKVHQILVRNSLPNVRLMDPRTLATRARELQKGDITISDLNNSLQIILNNPLNSISIVNGFRNLYEYQRGKLGIYRWNGLKYFLMEYEDYRRKKATKSAFVHIPWDKYEETSIEHIFPQTFVNNWSSEMNNYKSLLATNAKRSLQPNEEKMAETIIINTLGNFSIIQNVRNPLASNQAWLSTPTAQGKKNLYTQGCYTESYISGKYNKWDENSIMDNGVKMLEFMCQDYLLNAMSLSQQEINQILFYDQLYLP